MYMCVFLVIFPRLYAFKHLRKHFLFCTLHINILFYSRVIDYRRYCVIKDAIRPMSGIYKPEMGVGTNHINRYRKPQITRALVSA